MKILFFGKLVDLAGVREQSVLASSSISTLFALKQSLAVENPALGEALANYSTLTAINKIIVPLNRDINITDEDEIAFMPPLSGG